MKQKNTFLFGLICLAMCGLSSYPVLHMLAAVPVFPLVYDGTVLYLSGYLADRSSAKPDMQAGLPACSHQ